MKMKKKIISALCLLIAGSLAGCSSNGVSEPAVTQTESETSAENAAGEEPAMQEIPQKKSEFPDNAYKDIPEGYKDNITQHGTLEEFIYTAKNSDGSEYEKRACAYLPYGYDSDDTETKYNVLYLMHGGSDDETKFWDSGLADLLDAMFEKGDCEPCIVVTPNYRIPGMDETASSKNFYGELADYLIPAFESSYNTYAKDVSSENIKASRLHRAYGGFSMGACSDWAVFENCLDEIAYHMPISGDCWSVSGSGKDKAEYLAKKASEAGYTADDFYIYACCGNTGDIAYSNMVPQLDAMREISDTFIYCDNFSDGNFYYYPDISTGHTMWTVNSTIFNALPKFFG